MTLNCVVIFAAFTSNSPIYFQIPVEKISENAYRILTVCTTTPVARLTFQTYSKIL